MYTLAQRERPLLPNHVQIRSVMLPAKRKGERVGCEELPEKVESHSGSVGESVWAEWCHVHVRICVACNAFFLRLGHHILVLSITFWFARKKRSSQPPDQLRAFFHSQKRNVLQFKECFSRVHVWFVCCGNNACVCTLIIERTVVSTHTHTHPQNYIHTHTSQCFFKNDDKKLFQTSVYTEYIYISWNI